MINRRLGTLLCIIPLWFALSIPAYPLTLRPEPERDTVEIQQAVSYLNSQVGADLISITDSSTADITLFPVLEIDDNPNQLGVTMLGSDNKTMTIMYKESIPSPPGKVTVLIHEVAHALGLPHNNNKDSLMYWDSEVRGKYLTGDDIEHIKFLHREVLGYKLVKKNGEK